METVRTNTIQNILRIILALFMAYTAIGHLTILRTEFQAQVPNWVPFNKDAVVIISGLMEIFFVLSLIFWTKQKVKVGLALALFLLLVFPGNINQYLNHISAFGLNSDKARLIRLFLQPVLIIWALYCTGALGYLRGKR